ncbi:hypothetical protein [Angustibacter aerolatus]
MLPAVLVALVVVALCGGHRSPEPRRVAEVRAVCSGYQTVSHTVDWQSFLTHQVRAGFRECHDWIGTPVQLRHVYRPVITFPTSVPGGGVAEQLKIVRQPYLSSRSRSKWVYRFSVQQHIVHMPGGQTFDLELRVHREGHGRGAGSARLCQTRLRCSAYQR